MTLKSISTVTAMFAVTAILPLTAAARTTTRSLTPADEGAALLRNVQEDASVIANDADTLVSFANHPALSWQAHASRLTEVKETVNDMGAKLARLEEMRNSLPEWQQRALDRIAPAAAESASSTREAIAFLNANHDRLQSPEYAGYVKELYAESGRVASSAKEFEKYAKASSQEAHMEQVLGLKKAD